MANEYLMSNIDFNIKVVEINNKFYFEGAAAARNIGYSNETLALKRHVWDEYKTYIRGYIGNRNKAPKIMLTESGLYQLILNANTDKAKKFQKWVLEEVLPSLRRNGGYIMGQEKLSEDELNKLLSRIHNLEQEVSNARKALGMTGESKKRDAKEYRTLSMQFKAKADELDEEGDNILSNMNEIPNETDVFEGNITK